ncbi:ABC transporter substrate-binding protein [Siminovitchia sediminis]|uniref:ABC transporter substrate-binding protein n=1 Tax=Siminovitchia sediminis TaxID=1274353 RepID=A0ABW4KJE3_9BACI
MRRKGYIFGLFLAITLILSACGGGASESGGESSSNDTLVVVDWGGAITEARQKSIFEPFEEEFGVKIQVESPTDYGKFKAMVEGGNVTWDVVNIGNLWGAQAMDQDLFEPIDYDIVNKENVKPELAKEYYVGAEMYSTAIAYSTEQFSEDDHPATWADFWDVDKYPGARGLWKMPYEAMEVALLADGVKPEELYPLDIDRAFKSLEKLKEKTEIVWWDAGAQPVELLSSGTVTVSTAWNGRITTAKNEGAPVDLDYNQALLNSESWAVPKGAKNKDLAMEFINFATKAEVQAEFSKSIDYSPVNEEAVKLLPEEVQNRLGQSPELADKQVLVNEEYWAENFDEVNQRFQEWLLQQ